MILAAGYGTRLRPLTDDTPKALIRVGGTPLLGILHAKLLASGFSRIMVNTHHHASAIEHWVEEANRSGGDVRLSHEEKIMGTGGGVRNAAPLFEEGKPILVHNVDVLSDLSLGDFAGAADDSGASVLLAVQARPTGRALAVDEDDLVCGRWDAPLVRRAAGATRPFAFSGIQILAPGVALRLRGSAPFSLIDSYLALAAAGEDVRVFRMDDCYWADAGAPDRLDRINRDFEEKRITIERVTGVTSWRRDTPPRR